MLLLLGIVVFCIIDYIVANRHANGA